MLSSMPGASYIYGELVPTMWDGLLLLLRIIETFPLFGFSFWTYYVYHQQWSHLFNIAVVKFHQLVRGWNSVGNPEHSLKAVIKIRPSFSYQEQCADEPVWIEAHGRLRVCFSVSLSQQSFVSASERAAHSGIAGRMFLWAGSKGAQGSERR